MPRRRRTSQATAEPLRFRWRCSICPHWGYSVDQDAGVADLETHYQQTHMYRPPRRGGR